MSAFSVIGSAKWLRANRDGRIKEQLLRILQLYTSCTSNDAHTQHSNLRTYTRTRSGGGREEMTRTHEIQ